MTVLRWFVIVCDGASDECAEQLPPADHLAAARKAAREAGWLVNVPVDLCPPCQALEEVGGG